MHPVLARQLRRLGLSPDVPPRGASEWEQLLQRVSGYYNDTDKNRYLLERSLRVSSDELVASHKNVERLAALRIEESEARYQQLFDLTRIPTWEEDFTKASDRLEEIRRDGITDLEAYLNENPESLIKLISEVEVTAANPAVAQQLRIENAMKLLGPMDPALVLTEGTRSTWVAQFKTIWDGLGSARYGKFVGTRSDGTEFHAMMEWHAPVVGNRFDYSQVVVSVIDITERVEAERRMQDILDSKDEFLASISHEIRTPLTSVLGFAELLRSMGDDVEEVDKDNLLGIIADQASDISNIVEDLLVAARVELGQLTVVSVPVDISAQVNQVLEGRHATSQPIKVENCQPYPIKALGDPQRIRQILRNLLSNANKYGGDEISLKIGAQDNAVSVTVSDNGSGLPPEMASRIFERYYRAHARDGQPGSVGIGLTISRELARMMTGDLTFSREDQRTQFTLTLPSKSQTNRNRPR